MVAMGHDFTRMIARAAIGISYWLGNSPIAYNENEIHFHLAVF
jgi:hypothetical protein